MNKLNMQEEKDIKDNFINYMKEKNNLKPLLEEFELHRDKLIENTACGSITKEQCLESQIHFLLDRLKDKINNYWRLYSYKDISTHPKKEGYYLCSFYDRSGRSMRVSYKKYKFDYEKCVRQFDFWDDEQFVVAWKDGPDAYEASKEMLERLELGISN